MRGRRVLSTLFIVGVLLLAAGGLSPRGSAGDRNGAQYGGWGLLRFDRRAFARSDMGEEVVVPAEVWAAAADGGEVDVLVVLRGRTDLAGLSAAGSRQVQGQRVYDALRQTAGEAQGALRAQLEGAGIAYRPFYIVNAIQLVAGEGLLRMLAAHPDVVGIVPNTPVPGVPPGEHPVPAVAPQGIEPNLLRINADDVWALGYSGEGVVVAGQDTGYDWDHPALVNQYRGWDGSAATHDYNWHDAIHGNNSHTAPGNPCGFDSPVPCDDHGHGTHTMGTIAGDDGGANQIGVAPGARWIGCRNMEEGWGTPATYLECFEFFLAPYPVGGTPDDGVAALAPDVVSNSWGCPPQEGCDAAAMDLIDQAVSAVRQAGIVVVASAGNSGSACETVVNPPAISRDSVSVAAFDDGSGQIAGFSSRGPVTDGLGTFLKPDIAAPGVGVRSSVPGGGYSSMSGTSMAAPHVAGAVALVLSAAPSYARNVDAIEALLTSTAVARTTTQGCGGDTASSVPNNVWGWGELDALAAVESIPSSLVMGQIVDAEDLAPVGGAEIVAQIEGWGSVVGATYSDAAGVFSMTLPVGTYQLTIDAVGYAPDGPTEVQVSAGVIVQMTVPLVPVPTYYLPLVVAR